MTAAGPVRVALMMKRDECFRILAAQLRDEIVVAVYSSAFDWLELAPRALNYFSFGAMGIASSHGLGLALGRPQQRVIVLDGDGSLLMNLGTLVTIGAAAPKNLVHFVCRNGTYEANGGHPIPNPKVDFNGLARAAHYRQLHEFSELSDFEAKLPQVLTQEGPVFATLHLEKGALSPQLDYRRLDDAGRREAFKAALRQA
jgi:thiamine pyrophosphate-dependent acetolactate synthase large subunit-like protein